MNDLNCPVCGTTYQSVSPGLCDCCEYEFTDSYIQKFLREQKKLKKEQIRLIKTMNGTEISKNKENFCPPNMGKNNEQKHTGKCAFCDFTGLVQDVTIIDEMGTRYRSLCDNCISKNAGHIKFEKEQKSFFSSIFKSKKTQTKSTRKEGVCAFCERKGFVQEVTIVDEMGTRYRNLCDSCRLKVEKS